VYNYFFSVQRQLLPKTTLEVDYVGDTGHKLFRAESINREPGMRLRLVNADRQLRPELVRTARPTVER